MICVDASVAVKWILDEEQSDLALALYATALWSRESIVAPPLLPLEVTNILRQRVRTRDGLSSEEALLLLDKFLTFPLQIRSPAGLHRQALMLANAHDLPAAYDAHYLALAQHLECDLWTDDRRLPRLVGTSFPFLRRLSDYAPPAET